MCFITYKLFNFEQTRMLNIGETKPASVNVIKWRDML